MHVNSCRTLALVDSGAHRSCVSFDFIKRLKVPITPFSHQHYKRLSAADNHALISVGTVDLTLTIQGLKIPHTFNVVKQLNYEVILGVSFLTDTQAYIDFGNNTICICDDLVIKPCLLYTSPSPRD